MFLTHEDQRPFFGGTYFLKEPRYGMPAFGEILKRVAEYYAGHQKELREQNDSLIRAFDDMLPPAPPAGLELNDEPLRAARQTLSKTFDSNHGGFGPAPKFPIRRRSNSCCARGTRPLATIRPICRRSTWPLSRSHGWAKAACTTRLPVASAAIRWIRTG